MKYLLYGLCIDSEIDLLLPECQLLNEAYLTDISVVRQNIANLIDCKKSEGYYFSTEIDGGYWVCYEEIGDFLIKNGSQITADYSETTDARLIASVITNFCMAAAFYQRQEICLHGGCVHVCGKTVIISGMSGAGKSTLVTELMKNEGSEFLADDVVRMNGAAEACPTTPRQKLCADLAERMSLNLSELKLLNEDVIKYELDRSSSFSTQKHALNAMYILKIGKSLEIRKLGGIYKLESFLSQLYPDYLFQVLPIQQEQVKLALKIVSQIDIYEITRPKHIDSAAKQAVLVKETLFRGMTIDE